MGEAVTASTAEAAAVGWRRHQQWWRRKRDNNDGNDQQQRLQRGPGIASLLMMATGLMATITARMDTTDNDRQLRGQTTINKEQQNGGGGNSGGQEAPGKRREEGAAVGWAAAAAAAGAEAGATAAGAVAATVTAMAGGERPDRGESGDWGSTYTTWRLFWIKLSNFSSQLVPNIQIGDNLAHK